MILQSSPFILPLLISAVLTGVLAIVGWNSGKKPLNFPFVLLMGASTLWTVFYACQCITADPETNYLENILEYFGIVTVPVAWLLFALAYTGRYRYLTRKVVALLFLVPAIVVILVATNPYHFLYYSAISPVTLHGSTVWVYSHGPLFWIHVLYSYCVSSLAVLFIVAGYSGAPPIYKKQFLLLLFASGIPLLFNLLYISGMDPVPGLDLTPFIFTLSGLIVILGIFRYWLFSLMPVAYPLVFSSMSDGIVVIDVNDRIIDVNPAALRLIGGTNRDRISLFLPDLLPQVRSFLSNKQQCREDIHGIIQVPKEGLVQVYDLVCHPIQVGKREPDGWLIIFRDITEQQNTEQALKVANQKLNLVSSITRHDIRNELTVLRSNIELAREEKDTAMLGRYLERMEMSSRFINDILAFTKDYQEMGVKSPLWQDVSQEIDIAAGQVDLKGVVITRDVERLEVFADPLFSTVLYNLIENALRHGEDVTEIRFFTQKAGSEFLLVCEDDGAGVPVQEKSLIFERNFGKNTGLGLFLVREILAITNISIRETGTPGTGARFEISLPADVFRFRNDGE